jgi:hypothetical protein
VRCESPWGPGADRPHKRLIDFVSVGSTFCAVSQFTDFGIENLIELIKMHKDDPTLLKRYQPE